MKIKHLNYYINILFFVKLKFLIKKDYMLQNIFLKNLHRQFKISLKIYIVSNSKLIKFFVLFINLTRLLTYTFKISITCCRNNFNYFTKSLFNTFDALNIANEAKIFCFRLLLYHLIIMLI